MHFIQGTRYKVQPKKITQEMILKDARYITFCFKSNQVAVMAYSRLPTTFHDDLNDSVAVFTLTDFCTDNVTELGWSRKIERIDIIAHFCH